jgi:Uncharacterized protein conserved in bacteria
MKQWRLYGIIGFILLSSAYSYAWFLSAERLEQRIFKQVALLEQEGYFFAHDGIKVSGFPFSVCVQILDPRFMASAPWSVNISIQGPVKLQAPIFNLNKVQVVSHERCIINFAFLGETEEWALKAHGLDGHFDLKSPLTDLALTLRKPQFEALTASQLTVAIQFKAGASLKNHYRLTLTDFNPAPLHLPHLSPTIQEIHLDVSATGPFNREISFEAALQEWARNQGILEINQSRLIWDQLKCESNGTLTVDEALQPLMAFAAEIYGLDALLEKLGDAGYIKKAVIPLVKASLHLLKETKQSGKQVSHYHKVALSFQDGEIFLGPIPIAKLGTFNWATLRFNNEKK